MENVKTFDQLLDEKYGKKGNIERDLFKESLPVGMLTSP